MMTQNGNHPLVSICIPVYNEEKYLEKTLDCIQKQTYENFEVLIFDNNSTDRTVEICREFSKDDRFRIFRNRVNIGQINNFNRCYGVAAGEYVCLRSGNDPMMPDFIEKLVAPMRDDARVGLTYARCRFFDAQSRVRRSLPDFHYFSTDVDDPVQSATTVMMRFALACMVFGLYRRDLIERLEPFRFFFGSDAIFVCEASLYASITCVDEELHFSRMHGQRKNLVNLHSEDWVKAQPPGSPFTKFEQLTPFIDLLWGHLEMFGRAHIEDRHKAVLCNRARAIFRKRFAKGMDGERENVWKVFKNNERIFTDSRRGIKFLIVRLNFFERVKRAIVAFPEDERLRGLADDLVKAL